MSGANARAAANTVIFLAQITDLQFFSGDIIVKGAYKSVYLIEGVKYKGNNCRFFIEYDFYNAYANLFSDTAYPLFSVRPSKDGQIFLDGKFFSSVSAFVAYNIFQ